MENDDLVFLALAGLYCFSAIKIAAITKNTPNLKKTIIYEGGKFYANGKPNVSDVQPNPYPSVWPN